MTHRPPHTPTVVIHINDHGTHYRPMPSPAEGGASTGGDFSSQALDPYAAHREFPRRWAAFLRETFRGPQIEQQICLRFGVDGRTARNWLKGEGGCHGRHLVVAVAHHPQEAMATLFHMAAE